MSKLTASHYAKDIDTVLCRPPQSASSSYILAVCLLIFLGSFGTILISCSKRQSADWQPSISMETNTGSDSYAVDPMHNTNPRPPAKKQKNRQDSGTVRNPNELCIERNLISPFDRVREWQMSRSRYNAIIGSISTVPEWLKADNYDLQRFAENIADYEKDLRSNISEVRRLLPTLKNAGFKTDFDSKAIEQLLQIVRDRADDAAKYKDHGLFPKEEKENLVACLMEPRPIGLSGTHHDTEHHRSGPLAWAEPVVGEYEARALISGFPNARRVEVAWLKGPDPASSIGALVFTLGHTTHYMSLRKLVVLDDPVYDHLKPIVSRDEGPEEYRCYNINGTRFDLLRFRTSNNTERFWTLATGDALNYDGLEVLGQASLLRVFWPTTHENWKSFDIDTWVDTISEASFVSLFGAFERGKLTLRCPKGKPAECRFYTQLSGPHHFGTSGHEYDCTYKETGTPKTLELRPRTLSGVNGVMLFSAYSPTMSAEATLGLLPRRGPTQNLYTYAVKEGRYIAFYCPTHQQLWNDWSEEETARLKCFASLVAKCGT
ncbi:MAG TPA: hypothetical protein HPP83_01135 [Candidatus Hydrogenedentes bacterium]|nr:hypothetical protein [Candidatus Hydrogenedentota bacterium]